MSVSNHESVYKKSSSLKKTRKIYAIDLFCGAGGLTHGLERSGVKVRLGVDVDPNCEYPYTANNDSKFLLESVEELHGRDILPYYRKSGIMLLAGCAPCQTFSTYNQRATSSDKRWWLLDHFARLIREMSPDLVTMENVPRLEEQDVFRSFVKNLEDNEYSVTYEVVDCEKYGIPQHRSRLVLLASKYGDVSLISPEKFGKSKLTVKKAIGNLPPLEAGASDSDDPLHCSSALSDLNKRRIQASKPGGTWRDWPEELIADCHKKKSGRSYPGVYGRMVWDDSSPTITTEFFGFGNGRFGHPEQNRALSLREGAILQSFPLEYKFVAPGAQVSIKANGRLIGNAVPVTLGEIIGVSLYNHVSSIPSSRIKSFIYARSQ